MKKTKRAISLIISIILIISALPMAVFSAIAASESNGFAGGDGSVGNPYQVSTPEQLDAVRNDLSAHYVQINDIDMSNWENWKPIGTGDSLWGITSPANPQRAEYRPFSGSFDGGNYKIINLNIINNDISFVDSCYGLFSATEKAMLSNICLTGLVININKELIDYIKIQSENRATYAVYVGGIVGESIDSEISNCTVAGNISILNCYDVFVGGICGSGDANDCVNTANIYVDSVKDAIWSGGIIGCPQAVNSNLERCANYGNITVYSGGFVFAGGISGENGLISDCQNCGNIKGNVITPSMGYSSFAGTSNVGGITGATSSTYIQRCINYGQVYALVDCTKTGDYASYSGYAGGISGYCGYYGSGSIKQCYSLAGSVLCTKIVKNGIKTEGNSGRISGYSRKNLDCYSTVDFLVNEIEVHSSESTSNHGQDLSKEILLDEKIYSDFDFTNIWEIDSQIVGPVLRQSLKSPSPKPPITGETFKQLYFEYPVAILNIGETKQLVVHSHDVSYVNGETVYSNDRVMGADELVWYSDPYNELDIIKTCDDGQVIALKEGIEYVLVHSKNDINLGASCRIFVGNPNEFNYTATYDTKQYYAKGGFFSEVSSVSDCVEIYTLLENKLTDELKDLTSIGGDSYGEDVRAKFKDIAPITLTATVSGNGLSFDRDSDVKTYTVMFDKLSVGKAVDDVLMLFPRNINIAPSGNTYTVTVMLKSDSFETITEQYTFMVEDLETKNANEHISFTSSNDDYKKSKENIYGEEMATLKNDAEYKWSKLSSFDFDNYYEVVFADILAELMNVNQMGHICLFPVIKEWICNYKTILSVVSEIVDEDSLAGIRIPDNAVDKLLKKSKYVTDGMNVDDELRDLVVMKLNEKVSIDKINSAFAIVDKTQQFYSFFKLSKNITNDIVDYINSVSILNTYKEMNDDFKTVIKQLYNNIPDSEKKLKSAVNHYVNLDTTFGHSEEYYSEVMSLSKDITLDVFKTVYKAQFSAALLKSVGSISIKGGVALSSTAAFSSISTGLSAGTTLGFCISDILCNNSGKAAELSKTVAISEFSPYIINTLNHYESKLYRERNDTTVAEFENAFDLHKATQSYIMEHTVKALETKGDSIIIKLFSRDDYDGLISDILAQKSSIDNLKCHYDINQDLTIVSKTKVIAIKCPVNVFVYDKSGKEIVRIVNDITEYIAQEINVFVEDGEKYIALPASQKYSLKIVATDEGDMEYFVTEYGDGFEPLRMVKTSEIPLINGRVFTGEITESMAVNPESYSLKYDNTIISPDSVIDFPSTAKVLGDADGDGEMNVKDATYIQLYLANFLSERDIDLSVCDMDSDGEVNVKDATYIQLYLANLL